MLNERDIRTAAALLTALAARDPDHSLSREALRMAVRLSSALTPSDETTPARGPAVPGAGSGSGGALTVQAGNELARRAAARAVMAAQMRERAAEGARRAATALATLRRRQAALAERGWLPGRHNVTAVIERYEAARRHYDAREHTLINRALGILMAQQRCTTERALQTMHARAHRQGCDLPQIAIELIDSVSSPSPKSVQHSPAR